MESIKKTAERARAASIRLGAVDNQVKNRALEGIARALGENRADILAANRADLERSEKEDLAGPVLKRLKLDRDKIDEVLDGLKSYMQEMPAYAPRFYRVAEPKPPKFPAEDVYRLLPANQYMMAVGSFDDPTPFKLAGEIFVDHRPEGQGFAGNLPQVTEAEFMAKYMAEGDAKNR